LPLTGPGAWFGAEIKQGLELAVAELDPAGRRRVPPAAESPPRSESTSAGSAEPKGDPPAPPASRPGEPAGEPSSSASAADRSPRPPPEPIEPTDLPRTLALVVQAQDVQPLDVRDAGAEMSKLLSAGVAAVLTASPTPTLTVYPLAAARDVLVLHAGLASERFPATSRTLLRLRPSAADGADILGAHAWERRIRRLSLVTGGDDFGRAVRTALAARWRRQGGHLVHDESVSLDASDLRARLRAVARAVPEAVVLGFQGVALAEAARAFRDAGHAGLLLAMDDDRAALLASAGALDGALILSDAFVPLPDTRGARFARAYEASYGQPPSRFAASAYEAATLLAEAGRRSLREGRGLGGSRLRDVLAPGRRFPSLYAGELVVRDDGTVARPLALFQVSGGRLAFQTYVGLDGQALAAPSRSDP
jgi:ABC-type branched-subunit amino acid transport system substrate-binding protein